MLVAGGISLHIIERVRFLPPPSPSLLDDYHWT